MVLIGATTENPYFDVNATLVSRSTVFAFRPLAEDDLLRLLARALEDEERGMGGCGAEVSPEALSHLARVAGGDARTALTALELAVTAAVAAGREEARGGGGWDCGRRRRASSAGRFFTTATATPTTTR